MITKKPKQNTRKNYTEKGFVFGRWAAVIIALVREAGRHYLKDSQLTTNYPLSEIDEDRDATPPLLPPPQLSTVKLLILYFLLLSFSIKKILRNWTRENALSTQWLEALQCGFPKDKW